MDEETRLKILDSMTTERDLKNQFAYARKEGRALGIEEGRAEGRAVGIEEGRAEGRAEGRKEERILLATKMKAEGLALEVISRVTGLSQEECASL